MSAQKRTKGLPRSSRSRRGPGRPEEKEWPAQIDASPEDVARALMQGPPKQDWRYLRGREGE